MSEDICGIVATHPNKTYKIVVKDILEKGIVVAPRGQKTWELQPFVHQMKEPFKKLCSIPGRRANPFFNMAENMWILAGHGETGWICTFNNKLMEFQGDEGFSDFNAPYGRRIRFANRHRDPQKVSTNPYAETSVAGIPQVDQLQHCYESLKKDTDSRQAVVTLWNPLFDYHINKTKDRPCNTTIYFKIRNGHLNMTVSNRSNDVHLGLYGVNFVQFAHIQEFMAAALNVKIGHYVHLSDSLHIYENNECTKRILESDYEFDIYQFCSPRLLSFEEVRDSKKNGQINLGDFLLIADEVISDSLEFRKENMFLTKTFTEDGYYKNKFSKTPYALACSRYLFAYDLFKNNRYLEALVMIKYVMDNEFLDWGVLGIEFMMRKKEFSEFVSQFFDLETFLKKYFIVKDIPSILKYVNAH